MTEDDERNLSANEEGGGDLTEVPSTTTMKGPQERDHLLANDGEGDSEDS